MNNPWDLNWRLLQQAEGLRLLQAGQTWAVCRPGVEPGDADSALTGSLRLALEWYAAIQQEEVLP